MPTRTIEIRFLERRFPSSHNSIARHNFTRGRLLNQLSQLKHWLTSRPDSLTKKEIIALAERIIPRLNRNLHAEENKLLEKLKLAIGKYLKNNQELSPKERSALIRIKNSISHFLTAKEGKRFTPIDLHENNLPLQLQLPEDLIIKKSELSSLLTISFNLTNIISLRLNLLEREIEPVVQFEKKMSEMLAKPEKSSTIIEIFNFILLRYITESLRKHFVEKLERTGELTKREIEEAIKEINEKLAEIFERKENKKFDIKSALPVSNNAREIPSQETSEAINNEVTSRLTYDRNGNLIKVEVKSKAKPKELSAICAKILNSYQPKEIIALVKIAAQMITSETKAEIQDFVSTISRNLTQELLPDKNSSYSKQLAAELIREVACKIELSSNISADHKQAKLTFVNNSESQTSPSDLNLPKEKEPSPLPSKSEANNLAQLTAKVFSTSPETFIPLLNELYQSTSNHNEKEAIKLIISNLAQTQEGENYVIKNIQRPHLSTTEIGKEIILSVAKNFIEKTKAYPLTNFSSREQIVKSLLASNPQIAANLDYKFARSFIEIINNIQIAIEPPRKGKNVKSSRKVVSFPRNNKTPITAAKIIAQKALRQGKNLERAKAIQKVLKIAREEGLIIPKTIIENIYAALVGISVPITRADVPRLLSLPQESASASSLRRIVSALETQIAKAAIKKDPMLWRRVFTLSAQAFLYGTIMRLVKGRLKMVDEVIKALKEKKKLAKIIKKIKNKELESATEDIAGEVLEFGLSSLKKAV